MTEKPPRASWAQPSLSRDFALLSAAIVFVMLMISAWVAWLTYTHHTERVTGELRQETSRIERTLDMEMRGAGFLLGAVARQLSVEGGADLRATARLLKTFDSANPLYAVWSWVDAEDNIVVSSRQGVLDKPVSVADRDYVQSAREEPWVPHIGAPVEGRISGRWIIPVGIGVSDATGRYLGALEVSVDIPSLTDQISGLVKREGVSFAVVGKDYVPLTLVADSDEFVVAQLPLDKLQRPELAGIPEGLLSRVRPFVRGSMFSYFRVSAQYPYIIVVGYSPQISENAIRSLLWPRMVQIAVVAAFLLFLLWINRLRVVRPVVRLSEAAADIAGGRYRQPERDGPQELGLLAVQLGRIADYIVERGRVEDELRGKIAALQHRLKRLQMEVRSRAALLSGVLSEYKTSLRNINGYAQVMKDQLYGPIENKKYRQYAADIHQAGTTLELMVRKLIALSRLDAGGVMLRDEPVALAPALEQARRFVGDALPGFELKADVSEAPDVRLMADGMHVQQGLAYAMLYLAERAGGEAIICCRLRRLAAPRDEEAKVLLLGYGDMPVLEPAAILAALAEAEETAVSSTTGDTTAAQMHLALAEMLLESQQMPIAFLRGTHWLAIRIPPRRLLEKPEEE